jgi:hypothetical protein
LDLLLEPRSCLEHPIMTHEFVSAGIVLKLRSVKRRISREERVGVEAESQDIDKWLARGGTSRLKKRNSQMRLWSGCWLAVHPKSQILVPGFQITREATMAKQET